MDESKIIQFIETFTASRNVTAKAAVLFGSFLHKDESEVDDIDIFIVLAEDIVFRGNYYLPNGKRIDYFTGSLSLIEAQLDACKGTTDALPYYVFGEGRALFGSEYIKHLMQSAKDYLENFSGYENKEMVLKVLWYKLTDAYDDFIKTEVQMEKNLALAEIITNAMEFYCVYRDELVKKRGTTDRGEFYTLYNRLLSETNQAIDIENLLTFLARESSFPLRQNWEVQYQ